MNLKNIELKIEPPVALMTIRREQSHNAIDEETMGELIEAIDALEKEEGIRAVVITGNGKSFISGADIKEMAHMSPQEAERFSGYGALLVKKMHSSRLAFIAAVNGYAFGGGVEVALACDLILASKNAIFAQSETNLGIIPGWGGTQNLPRRLGLHKALKLILTAEQISAEEALRIGLIDEMSENQEELIKNAIVLGNRIAERSSLVIERAKECVYNGMDCSLEQGMALERAAFSLCFSTEDQREGMGAFLEKRKPVFRGR
jgi:enoyl-CoA hydratase